jgi:hypothetical protein
MVERKAFNQLETVMIESSLPKKVRVLGPGGESQGAVAPAISQRSKGAAVTKEQ